MQFSYTNSFTNTWQSDCST